MSYKKKLSDDSTRSPAQQRAASAGTHHAGNKPKAPNPDEMGLQPDEARTHRREAIEKGAAKDR